VLAAEITNDPGDFSHLAPRIKRMSRELVQAGVSDRPKLVVADAGYWNEEHINQVICDEHLQVLIPPVPANAPARVVAGAAGFMTGCDTL
jgi:hypothetical protein